VVATARANEGRRALLLLVEVNLSMRLLVAACAWCLLSAPPSPAADPSPAEKGSVHFAPLDDQKDVPPRYRLEARTFDFEMTLKHDLPASEVSIYRLRFPSAVESPHPENNTVHAEYYRPYGKGSFPGVLVLDVTAGDQSLSRSIATHLAQHGIAALFVQMAYYGPRRPPGSDLRLLSPDVNHSLDAVQQTVLDLRLAAAWMASRPELDPNRLGVLGTSLGSFMASLAAEMEPRLGRVAILLGGGGLVDAYYDHPRGAQFRKLYEALGGSREKLARLIAPADPITCAANLKKRKVLMLAGKRDDIVPPKMAEALWKASGEQKIVWYDCTHYGAIVHLPDGLDHIVKHFNAE
jgi:dienelactone hydrolase